LFKIGTVTHFYDKVGVAVIELSGTLSVGEKVRFVRGGEDLFTQIVDSIQVAHKKLDSAGKGDVIGLKTNEAVHAGTEIFKAS